MKLEHYTTATGTTYTWPDGAQIIWGHDGLLREVYADGTRGAVLRERDSDAGPIIAEIEKYEYEYELHARFDEGIA